MKIPAGETLILSAPKGASLFQIEKTVAEASKAHAGPVICLHHDWQAMNMEDLLKKISNIQSSQARASDGPSIGPPLPPPPPPPPGA